MGFVLTVQIVPLFHCDVFVIMECIMALVCVCVCMYAIRYFPVVFGIVQLAISLKGTLLFVHDDDFGSFVCLSLRLSADPVLLCVEPGVVEHG